MLLPLLINLTNTMMLKLKNIKGNPLLIRVDCLLLSYICVKNTKMPVNTDAPASV